MRLLRRTETRLYDKQPEDRTLGAWRSAAELVWTRWELVGNATPERRELAFLEYLAALDAEADAAAALAELQPSHAA